MERHCRILVADDDQSVVWLWTRLLQWGFRAEVTAVFDGPAAIEKLTEVVFDLVITDLNMPGASGIDVIRAAMAQNPGMPSILSTGEDTDLTRAVASQLGARFVPKPFHIDEAEEVIRKVLAEGRSPARSAPTLSGPTTKPGSETRVAPQ